MEAATETNEAARMEAAMTKAREAARMEAATEAREAARLEAAMT
jgi:hypothetical protein